MNPTYDFEGQVAVVTGAGEQEAGTAAAGDIGYWAPGGDLVFYYDSGAPFFDGIVRIGEFDGGMEAVERQPENFSVTIERAE